MPNKLSRTTYTTNWQGFIALAGYSQKAKGSVLADTVFSAPSCTCLVEVFGGHWMMLFVFHMVDL